MHAVIGDVILVESAVVHHPRRRGEVLEVLAGTGEEHYRVRWDDGHESVFCPGPDARVESR